MSTTPDTQGDVLVYAYWPNGERKLLQFHDWPQRHQLPADAVRFDIAWPDDSLRDKAHQCPAA